ncbi:putative oxidoreductase, 2OG-Fe(II) oxygenase family [Gordonia polyisoprenivorans VH2]|uniref:Putative oxidoreductase, 2OG-Fe(II) oxygenase family n=1 Tax=Gordonia polyisoprenivorans (strain DSM 44266 / VH2) TaxID=1112204 RepID=H6MZC3_GORPV|nr:2-oxoglutarate and iron-dependent oxygenase domain-containing protein [Gordonia polyisoprenivorans]AFA75665.1 putative oxidoreductase, 2OG-Fe(II) oxygenase family [Gordonia polyisoprenivorans VH2]OZC32696.1 oxidoreductase [Gordonia polyisoprenivorans]UZF56117.1 isopenicillin N synthase family oxygenase [Gordonia polyisoprenivorans]WCB37174.1 2-oxoglutarate and iron-dependent oxygenase domain-containing protein [Gordonia polyisoprenivorans]HCS57895.1 isopenicillin N synthase family oxygenase
MTAANPRTANPQTASPILTVDLQQWRQGGDAAAQVCAAVDESLQKAGFLLVTGHGIDPFLPAALRAAAREFFALPAEVKAQYAVGVGGRGWIGPGLEANGYAEGTETPPDLKETYNSGAQTPVGIPEVDDYWFAPDVWPAETPRLRELFTAWTSQMKALSDDLLALMAEALGKAGEDNPFRNLAGNATWTSNINHYPPMTVVGDPEPGQFRIGPHTDFGTVTVLDREPGAGGLQVYSDESGWADAPYDPTALTINIGDLLEYWSGGRWPAGRHRVLPPQPESPEEDLVSLIFFYELDHDAVVTPLAPPVGRVSGRPDVIAGEFIKERLDAITLG